MFYKTYPLSIAGNSFAEIQVPAGYLALLKWSDTTNDPVLQINNGDLGNFLQGMQLDLRTQEIGTDGKISAVTNKPISNFYTLRFYNNYSGSITGLVAVSDGSIRDSRFNLVSGAIPTTPLQATTGTYADDVTTGAAAKVFTSAACKSILIQADFLNTAQVFLGFDSSVSGTHKVVALSPGMAYQFDNFNGDIYAYSAAAQKISVSKW